MGQQDQTPVQSHLVSLPRDRKLLSLCWQVPHLRHHKIHSAIFSVIVSITVIHIHMKFWVAVHHFVPASSTTTSNHTCRYWRGGRYRSSIGNGGNSNEKKPNDSIPGNHTELILFGIDLSHLSPTIQFLLCASGVFFFTMHFGVHYWHSYELGGWDVVIPLKQILINNSNLNVSGVSFIKM